MQDAHGAPLGRKGQAEQGGGVFAVGDFGSPRVAHGLQDDDRGVGVGDLAHRLRDELEGLFLVRALQHRRGERLRGADPACGALGVRVEVRVFDGDAGGGGQGRHYGRVLIRVASGLSHEVEAPVDLLVDEDGDPEEGWGGGGQVDVGRVLRGVDEERRGDGDGRRQ